MKWRKLLDGQTDKQKERKKDTGVRDSRESMIYTTKQERKKSRKKESSKNERQN